jgi:arylsulfatase A-like enzyme
MVLEMAGVPYPKEFNGSQLVLLGGK